MPCYSIQSPNGRVELHLTLQNGCLSYRASKDGVALADESPLGIRLREGDLTHGLTLMDNTYAVVDETYTIPAFKKKVCRNHANTLTLLLEKHEETLQVEARAYDDGVALRMIVDGEGEGSGKRILNPQTIVYLEEGASIVMDTSQIGGVDDTKRYTKCEANGANSEVQINEKLLTAGDQHAVSEMDVILNGEGSRTRVVSRSVAKEASTQIFYPRVQGNAPCFGHVSCDSIIMGAAKVRSIPEISCNHVDAALMHEAAIGKIAGEQLLKLETLGLTPEEAEEKILEGFLR